MHRHESCLGRAVGFFEYRCVPKFIIFPIQGFSEFFCCCLEFPQSFDSRLTKIFLQFSFFFSSFICVLFFWRLRCSPRQSPRFFFCSRRYVRESAHATGVRVALFSSITFSSYFRAFFLAVCFFSILRNIKTNVIGACSCIRESTRDWHLAAIILSFFFFICHETRRGGEVAYMIFPILQVFLDDYCKSNTH